MFDNNKIKEPNKPFPSHIVTSDAIYFIPEQEFNKIGRVKLTNVITLQKNTELLVLEHGVGPNAEWCKIKLADDSIGYIIFENAISALNNVFPFYSINSDQKYLSDLNSPQIDWKIQKPNIAYEDNYNGAIIVHCELENVVQFSDESKLRFYMSQARKIGLKLILNQFGFQYNDNDLEKLLNEYYLFCTAEDWYIDPRPCSTLRIAVAIPKRYLYAQSNVIKDTTGKVQSSNLPPNTQQNQPEQNENTQEFILKFENYDKYKFFFDRLIETLGRYNFHYITKPWIIQPEGGINLFLEIENIKTFVNSTNELIARNHPKNIINETGDIIEFFAPTLSVKKWIGSLEFVIDRTKLQIKTIKYYSDSTINETSLGISDLPLKTNFSLMNGFTNYLNSLEIKNKTTINYILNFDPEKDFYDPLMTGIKSVGNTAQEALESPLETLNKASALLGGALKGLSGGQADEDLKNFLTSKHYPIITDIQPYPLDIFNCLVDLEKQTQDLISAKLPAERQKWKDITRAYEKNKLSIEADYFTKNISGLKDSLSAAATISDPNLRIIFGIDKLENLSDKQRLIKYLTIANSIDWAKYLGVAAQCLAAPLPPNVVGELLSKYQEAKKFIDQIFSITYCNPYIKSGFKLINGINLPTIEVFNSSQILANQLEAAFYKILTDLASAMIKKALEAAAKACAGNPAQNFNNTAQNNPFNNSDLNSPFNPSANVDEPAVDDILDDVFNAVGNFPNSANTPRTREEAKQKLKEIIDDISACLSLREMCFLYNGRKANDEVYQIVISLIKRKYGSPYSDAFATREQVYNFFKSLGNNIDLTACEEMDLESDSAFLPNTNIFCDDGRIENLRKDLLADHGLTPELIDEALKKLKEEETKALEDVLKLLNSPNPLDFSQFPNLACKVFPDGSSVAPSMDSFSDLINGLTAHVYDNFDNEATEWYKTTYSIQNPSTLQFLNFNSGSGKIEVNKDVKIDNKVGDNLRASSGKEDKATQEKNSKPDSISEIKYPSFIFKDILKNDKVNLNIKRISSNNNSLSYSAFLDSSKQQQLDINFITSELIQNVQNAEKSLSIFSSKLVAQIAANFASSLISFATSAAKFDLSVKDLKEKARTQNLDLEDEAVANRIYAESRVLYEGLEPLGKLVFLIDLYLRKNQVDAESVSFVLKDLYNYFNITSIQETNSIFAAENGSAIYFILGELLFRRYTWEEIKTIIDTPSRSQSVKTVVLNTSYEPSDDLESLYIKALSDWNSVEKFYKTIFRIKLNYPDFDLNYDGGLNSIQILRTGSLNQINSFSNNTLYDIQAIEVLRNKTNFVKFAEITEVNNNIYSFITGNLKITNPSEMNKPNLFLNYLASKMELYGRGEAEVKASKEQHLQSITLELNNPLNLEANISVDTLPADLSVYKYINSKLFNHIKNKILSTENKFIYLKDFTSPLITAIAESGSGVPYTKYLELVIPQNIQQKNCNIRPHYLDIDSIKKQIIDEKSNNMCVEVIADRRTVGNKPISSEELHTIETTSTQDAMLRGMYRLTLRTFLHDILLRGISVFGVYDPQSLRDEPAFITFMAKLAESEIRGADNNFFIMMTSFFLKAYKLSNPDKILEDEQLQKSLLFRDLVKQELQNYVLPKLAKRINSDTNLKLLNDIPRDNAIRLANINDEILKTDILTIKGNSIYINTNLSIKQQILVNGVLRTSIGPLGLQKIYEDKNGSTNQDPNLTYIKFKQEIDFDFLFKYIFSSTQTLNYYFMLNCLATGTRRQVVDSFMGTKKELIQICKTIQANGQTVVPNPNNIQSAASDPMDLIIGELLKMLLTTPVKVLKGIAEVSEPNIALISTVFKLTRSFVPQLPSFIIPATSIPLGLFPTPITCPLPFINPILAFTYFATFAWFDEKGSKKSASELLEDLVKNSNLSDIDCSNVVNQDLYYLNSDEIPLGSYNSNIDTKKQELEYSSLAVNSELQRIVNSSNIVKVGNSSVLETRVENLASAGLILLEDQIFKQAEMFYDDITKLTYSFNNIINVSFAYDKINDDFVANWEEILQTEQISDFINDVKTKDNIDYRDYFINLITSSMKEVEDQINKPPPPPTGSLFDDILALGGSILGGIFPQQSGTFRLIKEDNINSLRPYLGKSTPALRIGSPYQTYQSAYDKAIVDAKNRAETKVINFVKSEKELKFQQLKQKLQSNSYTDEEMQELKKR